MTIKKISSVYQYATIAILLVFLQTQFAGGFSSEDDDSVVRLVRADDNDDNNKTNTNNRVVPADPPVKQVTLSQPPDPPPPPPSTLSPTPAVPLPTSKTVQATTQPSAAASSPDPSTDKPSPVDPSALPGSASDPPFSAAPVTVTSAAPIASGTTSSSPLDLDKVSQNLRCVEGKVTPAIPGLYSNFCTKLMKTKTETEGSADLKDGASGWRWWHTLLVIVDPVLFISCVVLVVWLAKWEIAKKKKKNEVVSQKTDSNAPLLSIPPQPINPPIETNPPVEEVASPPSVNIDKKLKNQLQETQTNLARLRAHVRKNTRDHKSDTRSNKFNKKGPIFIPKDPDIPPGATDLPNNVILENVIYDPSGNEMYDIGSDVDDIELEPSMSSMVGSTISVEDEATKNELAKGTSSKSTPKAKDEEKPSKSTPKSKDEEKPSQKSKRS